MNKKLRTCFISAIYRVLALLRGPIGEDELAALLHEQAYGEPPHTRWHRLRYEGHIRALAAYAAALEAFALRDSFDPLLEQEPDAAILQEFQEIQKKQEYLPGGIIPTELFALYALLRHVQPQVYIESGTLHGYSAIIAAEALQANANDAQMYCLSLFEKDQRKTTGKRLAPYSFLEIIEGPSQTTIDTVLARHGTHRCAMLIDGPKARSRAWDELVRKVADGFADLRFLVFDAAHDHLPPYGLTTADYPLKRGINIERFKVTALYQNVFRERGYHLAYQSNRFCERYFSLNETAFAHRNAHWGAFFPWKPYAVDRYPDHVAIAYKLGMILHPAAWPGLRPLTTAGAAS